MVLETLKAGPELDALIAERVMGLNVARLLGQRPVYESSATCKDVGVIIGQAVFRPVKAYSTDISAAWEVVEMITRDTPKDLRPSIFCLRQLGSHHPRWECTFRWDRQAVGGSAAHAICLAALKALGIEVDR